MEKDTEADSRIVERESWLSGCLMWFFWGSSMSVMGVFSLVLLGLLLMSVALNVYLGWQLAGLEVAITRSGSAPLEFPASIATDILATIPTQTPLSAPPAGETPEQPDAADSAPALAPTTSPLEAQVATLSALATEVVALRSESAAPAATGTPPPTIALPAAVAAAPDESGDTTAAPAEPSDMTTAPAAPGDTAADSSIAEADESISNADKSSAFSAPADQAANAAAAPTTLAPYSELTSSNSYDLIPINGERDKRPAAEHGDLNLKLRDPQPIDVELGVVDVGSGVDADAPKLSSIFEPNFTAAYAVHDWDWGCNCKGDLIQDDQAILVGIKTTPGEPIFIPPTERDIYDGKYYAVVLYASEDSLTFVYAREGTVAMGYTVHYVGLRTDPNLLKLYQESKGSELPGLTLDTPVGIATDELLVAIRDNGKFLDARSLNDWWD